MKADNLAIAGLAVLLMASPVAAQSNDAPGMKEFGVDVSKAGSTKEENQAFVQTLTPPQKASIEDYCLAERLKPTPGHPPVVVMFCGNLYGT